MTEPLRRRVGEEEGMVTAFVVIFTLALLAMAGLVLDGGLALAAKVHAINDAQAAARAGAQAIDIPLYRSTGTITLDPAQATADAQAFLAAAGSTAPSPLPARPSTSPSRSPSRPRSSRSSVSSQLTVSGAGSATAQQGP